MNSTSRNRYRGFALLSASAWLLPAGLLSWSCSSPTEGGSTTGGAPATTGGATVTGGVAATTGGTSSTGGTAPITGGASNTGGSTTATGGSTSTGGVATGGSATGGSASTGGTAQGGAAQGGAMPATGGSGGGSSTGGSATGGSGAGAASTGGSGGAAANTCTTAEETKFSFFLVSNRALQRESGSPDGFGGDFKGITGADGICQRVAEFVSPCQKSKVWHAFLSTTTVNAGDRIGTGPWYDRKGRLLANNLTDLMKERPMGADPAIVNDFPNEEGTPNHNPDGTGQVDNHETLTGTGIDGKTYTQSTTAGSKGGATSCGGETTWSKEAGTCWDWTNSEPKGCPRVGHSWPRAGSGLHWISVWNEGGCAPGGNLTDAGGLDGTRKVGSAGGYGGYYCFAVRP